MYEKEFEIDSRRFFVGAGGILCDSVLYSKKKNLALTLLAMGSVGGAAGAYLVLKEAKLQMQAKEQAALDTFSFDDDDDALFDEEEDDSCCDCSDCSACEKEPQDDVPAKN